MKGIVRITPVCMGGHCRAPLTAAALRSLLEERGVSHVLVGRPAGITGNFDGRRYDRRCMAFLDQRGLSPVSDPALGISRTFAWTSEGEVALALDARVEAHLRGSRRHGRVLFFGTVPDPYQTGRVVESYQAAHRAAELALAAILPTPARRSP